MVKKVLKVLLGLLLEGVCLVGMKFAIVVLVERGDNGYGFDGSLERRMAGPVGVGLLQCVTLIGSASGSGSAVPIDIVSPQNEVVWQQVELQQSVKVGLGHVLRRAADKGQRSEERGR